MKVTRRALLGGAAAGVLVAGCEPLTRLTADTSALEPPTDAQDRDWTFLDKFGYGPRPGDLDKVKRIGRKAWLEEQMEAPETDPVALAYQLRRLDIFHFSAFDLRNMQEEEIIRQLQQAAFLRAAHSPWQLRERMVDFWGNHFSIFAKKGLAAYRKPEDERNVARAHVFGSFSDMLMASAKSTAMLLYLDQQASSAANPNENYARELLELHSLGVDAGYTQQDVMEVARCFTGWSEERRFLRKAGSFRFREDLHDSGPKSVLGHQIPAGGGVEDGEKVVRIAATHPATAKHLATKLCDSLLGSDDPQAISAVATTFEENKGDIKATLRTVHEQFEQGHDKPAIKRPFDYMVSALRVTGASTDGNTELQAHLRNMGQPLYEWPMPDGYPTDTPSWTGSLLARWNFASDLAQDGIKGTRADLDLLAERYDDASAPHFILNRPSGTVADVCQSRGLDLPQQAMACLAAPEFQWK